MAGNPWRSGLVVVGAVLVLAGCGSRHASPGDQPKGGRPVQSTSRQAAASGGQTGSGAGGQTSGGNAGGEQILGGTGGGQYPIWTGPGPQPTGTNGSGQATGTTGGQATGTTGGQATGTTGGQGGSEPSAFAIQFGGPSVGSPEGSTFYAFGDQPVGQRQSRAVNVTAASDTPLPLTVPITVDRVDMDGNSAFSIAADDCSGKTLQPNATCKLMIAFLPLAPGKAAATLKVWLTANCSPTSTYYWCAWHQDEFGHVGDPYERVDLPDGGALIRYTREYASFTGVGV